MLEIRQMSVVGVESMVSKSNFLYGTALAVTSLSPVYAGDLPQKNAPLAPAVKVQSVNWTGFEIGVGGGYGFLGNENYAHGFTNYSSDYDTYIDQSNRYSPGGFATIEARANYQTGSVVIGLVGSYDFGRITSKSSATHSIYNTNDGSLSTALDIDSVMALGGRIGLLANDSTLLFASGGYTSAEIKNAAERVGVGNPTVDASSSERKNGYFVGGGAELLLSSNLTFSLEYRYSQFGNIHIESDKTAAQYVEADFNDINTQSVRGVLALKF